MTSDNGSDHLLQQRLSDIGDTFKISIDFDFYFVQ